MVLKSRHYLITGPYCSTLEKLKEQSSLYKSEKDILKVVRKLIVKKPTELQILSGKPSTEKSRNSKT